MADSTATITVEEFNKYKDEVAGYIATLEQMITSYNSNVVHQLFVNGNSGSDSNDGQTTQTPFRSLDKALAVLRSMSDVAVDGTWEIKVSGTINKGHKINNLPRFRFPLKITGEVNPDGSPAAVFDGATAATKIGLWIEPCPDLRIEVRNILFKNYKNNFNGYGLLMKSGGYLITENCRSENCDIGFAAIRNVSYSFQQCVAIDCETSGFRTQYCSGGTFGSGFGGTLDKACIAINCGEGFTISRNSVCHVDYSIADGCKFAGISIDHNSRAHVLGTILRNNKYGVRTEGGGEWLNNIDEVNIFENNEVNYAHFGNSRETRLYSQNSNNEFRIGVRTDTIVHTGTTANTPVYAGTVLGKLPKDFFLSKNQRLRFLLTGIITGSGNKTISIRSTDTAGGNNVSLNGYTETGSGAFQIEMLVYPIDNTKVRVVMRSFTHLGNPRIYSRESTIDLTKDRLFRAYCQLEDGTNQQVEFTSFETFLMG
ncbi:right-handed parallel beta-helix repeat-containing protein [Priestia megaterium]